MLHRFFLKVQGTAGRIFQVAVIFSKIFPCRVPEFSMFYKKLACMHECSMEKVQGVSTRGTYFDAEIRMFLVFFKAKFQANFAIRSEFFH